VPSVHYATIAERLRENMELLSGASGESEPKNRMLLNMGNAFLALSDALQDEFVYINTRLTYIEQQLDRPDLLVQK
jgi:hypothetical protein